MTGHKQKPVLSAIWDLVIFKPFVESSGRHADMWQPLESF
jgi:hypothetical protein